MMKNYKFFAIFIISLALFVRFVSLEKMSFWSDELLTLHWADEAKSTGQIIYENLTYPDQSPPFFTLLVHMWLKIFGHQDGWLRTLPALISFLCLLAIFRLFNSMGGDKSLIYLSLIAFSGYYLYLGRELRPYGLLLLAAMVNHYYFLKGVKSLYSLTLFVGVLVNPFMWLVFISQVVYLWLIRERTQLIKIIKLAIPAGLFYIPYLIIIGRQVGIYKGFPVFSFFMVKKLAGLFLHLTTGFKVTSNIIPENYFKYLFTDIWFIPCLVLTGIIFFLVAKVGIKRKLQDRISLFSFVNIVVPILIVGVLYPRRLGPRTLCIIAPFYHFLALKGMELYSRKLGYVVTASLFLFINILSGKNLITASINPYISEDWKSLASNIDKEGMYFVATEAELELAGYYLGNNDRLLGYDPGQDEIESWALLRKKIERFGHSSIAFLLRDVKPYPVLRFRGKIPTHSILDNLFETCRFEGVENYGHRLKVFKFQLKEGIDYDK